MCLLPILTVLVATCAWPLVLPTKAVSLQWLTSCSTDFKNKMQSWETWESISGNIVLLQLSIDSVASKKMEKSSVLVEEPQQYYNTALFIILRAWGPLLFRPFISQASEPLHSCPPMDQTEDAPRLFPEFCAPYLSSPGLLFNQSRLKDGKSFKFEAFSYLSFQLLSPYNMLSNEARQCTFNWEATYGW